jgi:hypothetical protein
MMAVGRGNHDGNTLTALEGTELTNPTTLVYQAKTKVVSFVVDFQDVALELMWSAEVHVYRRDELQQ